jgi:hypothetical protein
MIKRALHEPVEMDRAIAHNLVTNDFGERCLVHSSRFTVHGSRFAVYSLQSGFKTM